MDWLKKLKQNEIIFHGVLFIVLTIIFTIIFLFTSKPEKITANHTSHEVFIKRDTGIHTYEQAYQNLLKRIEEEDLSRYKNEIINFGRPAIKSYIDELSDEYEVIATSRFGGLPDLPDSIKWPEVNGKKMKFITQINLEDLNEFDTSNLLPESGMLYFFIDKDNYYIPMADKKFWKVLYTDDLLNLKRIKLAKKERLLDYSAGQPCSLAFSPEITIPGADRKEVKELLTKEEDIKAYWSLYDDLYHSNAPIHRFLGYPLIVQSDDMEKQSEFIAHGINIYNKYDENHPQIKAILDSDYINNWILLFQLEEDYVKDRLDMVWGDAATLYFWIRKEDLENKNFDKVQLLMQSF